MRRRSAMYVLLAVVLVGLLVFWRGPRVRLQVALKPVEVPYRGQLDAWLAQREAQFDDLTPGTEKTIQWMHPDQRKTPLSIVYIHGFSATRQETAPLAAEVANELRANLFETRLRGHGRPAPALEQSTAHDWLEDAAKAFAIGREIGDRVIVLGVSNGCPVALWHALEGNDEEVAAYVLVSPNFGPADKRANLLLWPWAQHFVPVIAGHKHTWKPQSTEHGRFWTTSYEIAPLFEMMALVDDVRRRDFAPIKQPVLTFYSPKDAVVDANRVPEKFQQFASPRKQLIKVNDAGGPQKHILAGRILSPETTDRLAGQVTDFVRKNVMEVD